MEDCKHMVTQGREGESGSWCVKCGEKVLEVEKRICDHCIHFTIPSVPLAGSNLVPPYCKKKMMTLCSGLHVTYHVSEGTCFEQAIKSPEYPWELYMRVKYKDGQPCSHRGCMAHISHPCEGCGRMGARGTVYEGLPFS